MTFNGRFPLENVPMPNGEQNVQPNGKEIIANKVKKSVSEKKVDGYFKNADATGVILNGYTEAKKALENAKNEEKRWKDLVMNHIGERLHDGTNRYTTDFNCLKIVKQPTLSLEISDMTYFQQCLGWIAQCLGNETANNLISWKPSLDKRTYDSLPEEIKAVFNQFVTLKYNSPSITIEEL